MKSVCVYCGSSSGTNPAYIAAATDLGKALAQSDIELVYGGAQVGLMGRIADEAIANGGKVTGVIPESLMDKEVGHEGLSTLHVVADMHERKALMINLSDGFIAMPGGFGTMEELFEALTWLQLGFHQKPCAVLNVENYYQSLLNFLDASVKEGFVKQLHRDMLIECADVDELLSTMAAFSPPKTTKWIGFGE